MNRILPNIVFFMIFTVVLTISGRLFVISSIDLEIDQARTELEKNQNLLKGQKDTLENLPEKPDAPQEKTILLSAGKESQLMKYFLSKNFENNFKINSYELFSSYFYKPEYLTNAVSADSQSNNFLEPEMLAKLDEDGMPLNAYAEDEAEEWPGLEITPVKITFLAKASAMSSILQRFWKMPANTIRAADLVLDQGIIKGTLIFAFPLNE